MAASRQKLMRVVRQAGNDYFATSTIHGFAYWVAGKSDLQIMRHLYKTDKIIARLVLRCD